MLDANHLQHQIAAAMANNDWALVAELEPQLDAVQPQPNRPSLLQSALWYTALGIPAFPCHTPTDGVCSCSQGDLCHSPGKHPRTRNGLHEATTNGTQIRRWWKQWPTANIGLATGHQMDVIDIDGPVGVKSWAAMDNLPHIYGVVTTPRIDAVTGLPGGGTHLYVPPVEGRSNKANLAAGVDYRGLGGYVIAPPSTHPSGGRYYWRRPLQLQAAA